MCVFIPVSVAYQAAPAPPPPAATVAGPARLVVRTGATLPDRAAAAAVWREVLDGESESESRHLRM